MYWNGQYQGQYGNSFSHQGYSMHGSQNANYSRSYNQNYTYSIVPYNSQQTGQYYNSPVVPQHYHRPTPFEQFDLNRDGLITIADFRIAARQYGFDNIAEDVLISVFRTLDRDRSGTLDHNEVASAFKLLNRLYGYRN